MRIDIQFLYACILLSISAQSAWAQNLVPNPNFDRYIECPYSRGQIHFAEPWFSPNGRTTDFVHYCSPDDYTGVPTNQWGFQEPAKGSGYAGIRTWGQFRDTANLYREYLAVKLKAPLEEGEKYFLSFQISPGEEAQFLSDDVAMALTTEPIPRDLLLTYSPVLRNPSGFILDHFFEWRAITGEYIAQGGEEYLVIGNFLDDPSTTIQRNTREDSLQNSTYFFIDAVVVELCKNRFPTTEFILSTDTAFCAGESLPLMLNPQLTRLDYTWSNGSTDSLLEVSEPGRYFIDVEGFGCTLRDSIEIFEHPLPPISLGNDTTLCEGDAYVLELDTIAQEYLWSTGNVTPSQLITGPETYSLLALNEWNCARVDTLEVRLFDDPPPNFEETVQMCEGETTVLSAGYKDPAATYRWNGIPGDSVLQVSEAGRYEMSIETPCTTRKNIFTVELEDCSCEPFIPNVFSPNQDGVNDEWQIQLAPGVTDIELYVFDRWGRQLFQSQSIQDPWDGQYNRQMLPTGVYYWSLQYVCFQDAQQRRQTLTGWLSLMR